MWNPFKKKIIKEETKKIKNSLSNIKLPESLIEEMENKSIIDMQSILEKNFPRTANDFLVRTKDSAMDSSSGLKPTLNNQQTLPNALLNWYGSQSFIGYQACAILYQNWLMQKGCNMPVKDAIRNGYEITINNGTEVDEEVIDEIKKLDKKYLINEKLEEFGTLGRVFGIRVAMFKVESDDPDFYFKIFNINGIKPGSYKGVTMIDPYWITAQLDTDASGDPASLHFYEPTWWKIGDKLVHRTHLIIFRNGLLPDILKPTYYWGGIPVTQQAYEAIYNACRGMNELLGLLVTKRTDIIYLDTALATGNPKEVINALNNFIWFRDNYGVKTLGLSEKMERLDTALADSDQVVMTLFQNVAAAFNVPITKLFGTVPKGFNATGEYDEANYHEFLKSLQIHNLTPFLDRHHLLLIRSEIAPNFNIKPFETTIEWKPLDEMTAKELAETNESKSRAGNLLVQSGAISPQEERQRIINDPSSGYSGLDNEEFKIIESEEQE